MYEQDRSGAENESEELMSSGRRQEDPSRLHRHRNWHHNEGETNEIGSCELHTN